MHFIYNTRTQQNTTILMHMHTHAHTHFQEMVPAASQQATQFISETSKHTHCTEHSHTLASSREYDRMLHNFDKIIEQLADAKCSGPLADKLYSRELISKQVHEEGVNVGPGIVESGRIRCMIKAVLAKVRTNTEHCSTFIKILKKIGGQEDLLQLLQGTGNRSNIYMYTCMYFFCMHCSYICTQRLS